MSLDPAELEILRLKRAKVDIKVVADLAQSEFLAVLEFRGRTLVLTRKSGTANAGGVAEDLADDYAIRYEKDGLLELDEEEDAECECTIVDPDDFLDFLHLLKVRGGITYTTGAT